MRDGGHLLFTGKSGRRAADGSAHAEPLLQAWRGSPAGDAIGHVVEDGGSCLHIPEGPWTPDIVPIVGIPQEMPIFPRLEEDPFGQQFLRELEQLAGPPLLTTDAPWFVRVRAWLPQTSDALVVHWINYRQDEDAVIEIPIPVGPLQAACRVPEGFAIERVEWRYPEMKEAVMLECETSGNDVRFVIPSLVVYGMSMLHLRRR